MVPVRQAGNEDAINVRENRAERFRIFWSGCRECSGDLSRRDTREDGQCVDALEIVSDPVDELVTVLPERARVHGANHTGPTRAHRSYAARCAATRPKKGPPRL